MQPDHKPVRAGPAPRRGVLRGAMMAAAILCCSHATVSQQQNGARPAVVPLRLAVLSDFSGPYADVAGGGSVTAVELAIQDFGGRVLDRPIELIKADHQNKPDVALGIARDWFDNRGVAAIFDLTNSTVALAVANLAREKDRIAMISGSGSTRLSTDACTPNSVQYVYDSNSTANVIGKTILAQGGKNWFFVTVDLAFGQSQQDATAKVVTANGGAVLGAVKHPLGAGDFSAYMLQAQASGADVVALANAGADMVNAVKTANEFGTSRRQRVIALVATIADIHSLGLEVAQNTYTAEAFYWNADERTRAWAQRFFDRTHRMPTMYQAGMYSATLTYLKAVAATGTDAAQPVMAAMKVTPIDDVFSRGGRIRPDGLHVHDMYLLQAKSPAASQGDWDDMRVVSKVPAEQAFGPMVPGACPYVK